MKKEEFIRRILADDSVADEVTVAQNIDNTIFGGDLFGGEDLFPEQATAESAPGRPRDHRFAQLLLETIFGPGQSVERDTFVLGDQKTRGFLETAAIYWPLQPQRPFHTLLVHVRMTGTQLMKDGFFTKRDQLEDALHRIIQDSLDGFTRQRSARDQKGEQSTTLCVVSVLDDRLNEQGRHLVCFGTTTGEKNEFVVFTIREEVKDWERQLAEEHLEQLYLRHFAKLTQGDKWKEAFISGPELTKAEHLNQQARIDHLTEEAKEQLFGSVSSLLEEVAMSFAYKEVRHEDGLVSRLRLKDLPEDHSIGTDPLKSRGKANRLRAQGVFDSGSRLLGYIVYVIDQKTDLQTLQSELRTHNHFHNVLLVYADTAGGVIELWQGGEPLRGRLTASEKRAQFDGAAGIVQLLTRFFVVSRSRIETPAHLARELAWRARHVKAVALEQLRREQNYNMGPLLALFRDMNHALTAQEPEQFADTYAQTVTYGLLAARWLARDKGIRFSRREAKALLPSTSEFLRDLFDRLINDKFETELTWLIDDIVGLLSRTLVRTVFKGASDPSIHFYEDFLDAYDPALRKRMGVYYTPDEVVQYMVQTVDELARTRLGLPLGLADSIRWGEYAKQRGVPKPSGTRDTDYVVQILDPATGTGTFLLHTVTQIFRTMTAEYDRRGYSDDRAATEWKEYVRNSLLPRLNGFELMMAPYIVAHLRLGLALDEGLGAHRASLTNMPDAPATVSPENWRFEFGKNDRLRIFLTNTLDLNAGTQFDWLSPKVAEEAATAEILKRNTAILIILGNPPYERFSGNADPTVQWLRHGQVPGRQDGKSLFDDVRDYAREATVFSHLRSLPDRYVYFWRWCLWKVFEQRETPGILALITNSRWLTGPGFVGLRKIAREQGEEMWTVDLGGENAGTMPEANVFNIETAVAISLIARSEPRIPQGVSTVRYRKIFGGSGIEKRAALVEPCDLYDASRWTFATSELTGSLVPATGDSSWYAHPSITELFPWQQPGCLVSRTWPIAPDATTLQRRWRAFVESPVEQRPLLFATAKTGRNVYTKVPGKVPLATLREDAPTPSLVRYALRSFDRQWILDDTRLLKTESPSLWRTSSGTQVYFCSLLSVPISKGPALIATAYIPDFHHFRGSYGGKDVIPLYRDTNCTEPNVSMKALNYIASNLGFHTISAEHLAAYVYALLSSPAYQNRFMIALRTPGVRVPITRDRILWDKTVAIGTRLIWLHTFSQRMQNPAAGRGDHVPMIESIRWTKPVSKPPISSSEIRYLAATSDLQISDGVISGVRSDVMGFSVSGMPVVHKWLGYRTLQGAGRATSSTSPLDKIRPDRWCSEWNTELLELLSVLTHTLDLQTDVAVLLDEICEGPLIHADELPKPTAAERAEPKVSLPSKAGKSKTRDMFEKE